MALQEVILTTSQNIPLMVGYSLIPVASGILSGLAAREGQKLPIQTAMRYTYTSPLSGATMGTLIAAVVGPFAPFTIPWYAYRFHQVRCEVRAHAEGMPPLYITPLGETEPLDTFQDNIKK